MKWSVKSRELGNSQSTWISSHQMVSGISSNLKHICSLFDFIMYLFLTPTRCGKKKKIIYAHCSHEQVTWWFLVSVFVSSSCSIWAIRVGLLSCFSIMRNNVMWEKHAVYNKKKILKLATTLSLRFWRQASVASGAAKWLGNF